MNTSHEKILLDSSAFYTFIRHYKNKIDACYEMNYYYYDTEDMTLIKKNQTARLRSIQSKDYKAQWEFRFNNDVIKSQENIITTNSAFIQLHDAESVITNPSHLLTAKFLPETIHQNLKDIPEASLKNVAMFRINRKYLSFGEILIKADEFVYGKNSFYEIGFNSNNRETAKEKMKEALSSLGISFSFSTLSKLSRVDSFIPYLDPTKSK
ncbi:hypothetical protein TRFO_08291 [Tritrichomonas foetus]|uniref:CYTH domain-containing protein n=1 Tax=Tritrichomonas foetus TaxID=1144522 RepID=A0A1J4JQY4_9EUKA|nr:hypothetical protein TRFO_08291 [Tritrichomonas foetus]|eukprot:OHS99660.1 hypothetical protein TRFO_08291 [Tritrichomonas foetus]